jgi:peroxiredoxin
VSVSVGRKVPEFSLPATGGATWRLREAGGHPLVL